MHQVLYRKWRPKKFDDVIGQSHIISVLKNEVIYKKISHAYLFNGGRGSGKTTCARILAKGINCLNQVEGSPCLECEVCIAIENNKALDIVEIDAASNNGVENIRDIQEKCSFLPTFCKYKVYIIDEFHMLSAGAFNALLKILEEPISGLVFILATTEIHKIPKTVISRCQKFDFFKISETEMIPQLKFISKNENISITEEALKVIADTSDGSLRDALSILEECMIFSLDNMNKNISENDFLIDVKNLNFVLGLIDKDNISNLGFLLANRDFTEVNNEFKKICSTSKSIPKICEGILSFFRTVFLYISLKSYDEDFNFKEEIIKKTTELISLNEAIDFFDILKNSYLQMNKTFDPKFELELAFVKICFKKNEKSDDSFFFENKVNALEKKTENKTKEDKTINNEQTNAIFENDKLKNDKIDIKTNDDDKNFSNWPNILEKIKGFSRSTYFFLRDSTAFIEKKTFFIKTSKRISIDCLNKNTISDIEKLIFEFTNENYKINILNKNEEKYNKKNNDNGEKKISIDELLLDANKNDIIVE